MPARKLINDESGIALVIALVMLLALTVIGISSLMTSTLDTQISGNERRGAEALNLADAGLERAVLDLLSDFDSDANWSNSTLKHPSLSTPYTIETISLPSNAQNYGNFGCTPQPDCFSAQWGDPFGAPLLNGTITNAVDLYGSQELGDGTGNYYRVLLLREASSLNEIYVRSYALHSTGARKIIQLHIDVDKIDAWRNALFAGRGSASASIQGNINVAGSVHVLGTGNLNNWTISGSASVSNGYHQLASSIRNKLLELEIVGEYNGKPIYSLESEFRVKNVQVGITGSGNIGQLGTVDSDGDGVKDLVVDTDGNYYKANVDLINSNKVIDTSDTNGDGVPDRNIYADEVNMPGGYDLGDKIQMPSFEDRYENQTDRSGNILNDPATQCPTGTCTYENYIDNMSYVINGTTIPATSCKLEPGVTDDFCMGCAYGADGNPGTADDVCLEDENLPSSCTTTWNEAICGHKGGCIKWTKTPAAAGDPNIVIAGRVKIKDCSDGLMIGPPGGGDNPVTYKGKGVLYTPNKVTIDESLLAYSGGGEKFVQDNFMAVMTKNNMSLAPSAGEVYMGAFFSAGTIGTTKGGGATKTSIVGAMVANLFCMGSGLDAAGNCGNGGNSADVYYTPGLSEELKKVGMLMGDEVYVFDTYEWEEVF